VIPMVEVEVANRSGAAVDEEAAVDLARRVVAAEGIEEAELGLSFVAADEARRLKQEHLGVDETPDVLAFPIDGRSEVPEGVPRQLGDVVICPEVVGHEWREPLVHGLLHLLGYEHGAVMERREQALRA
jgi:probable rRNA maturation factor